MLNFLKLFFRAKYTKKNPFVFNSFPTKSKEVLITFDDGPYDPQDLYSILEVLDEKNIKVIFFLNGIDIADLGNQGFEVCKKILENGHLLGSHCYRHLYYDNSIGLFESDYTKQDILFSKIFRENNIDDVRLNYPIRMPYLHYFRHAENFLKSMGKKSVMGGIPVGDWVETIAPENISKRAVSKLLPGTIFVFHIRSNTAKWLPIFLRDIAKLGYCAANPFEVTKNCI